MGFASGLTIRCTKKACKFSEMLYSSKKAGQACEINRRAVLASRNIGVGHQGLVKLAAVLDLLPPMNKSAYKKTVDTLKDAAEIVAEQSKSVAANETKEFYEAGEDGITDIAVSGDGTVRKRKLKSSCGVVSVISLITGKVLDAEIMSKEYRECIVNTRKEGSPEFVEWWESHQHACHAHFHGSSGAMDPTVCFNIFNRSIEKHSVRYKEFLGDGDSKTHNELVQQDVYDGHIVEKLECVGHVKK